MIKRFAMESSKLSMFVSSLGWILLVAGAGAFLWYGRPYYYEQGRQDQFEQDVQTVDAYIYPSGGRQTIDADQPVVGIISSIEGSQIDLVIESALINPLVPERETAKTVMLTADTEIVIGRQLSQEEFQARFQRAEADGQDLAALSPVNEEPGTLADLEPGDRIAVYVTEGSMVTDTEFTASRIEFLEFHGQAIPAPAELEGLPQVPNPEL